MTPSDVDNAKSIIDAIDGGVIVVDGEARITRWNAWMESASGHAESELRGKTLAEVFPGVDLKRLPTAINTALRDGAATIITHALNPTLLPMRTRSGRTLMHDITVSPVVARGTTGCLIFVTDITMATKREQYLRKQQDARYDAVVEGAPDAILTIDEDGFVQFANPAATRHLGRPTGEFIGTSAVDLFETREQWLQLLRDAMENRHVGKVTELIACRKDGSRTHLEASASCWKSGSRMFVTAIFRDINERRAIYAALRQSEEEARASAAQLAELNETLEQRVQRRTAQLVNAEEALRQSQKMEAIGNLTGGIAHDFNNLLHVIGIHLHLLKRDVAGNAAAEARVRIALDGVVRSSKLSSQLLSFARRQALDPKVINLGKFIADMEELLRKAVGDGVTLRTHIAPHLWNTLIDPANVESALLNLSLNARDAMDGQGNLVIAVQNVVLDADYAQEHEGATPGEYVLLAVTDTGKGMTPEVVKQAFEPFFTTKPVGKGTGLGLSMVYGFVKQSAGYISIHSEVGAGTTIRLYLPRSTHAEQQLVDVEAMPVEGGSEMILVAEDDPAVRETVVGMLAELGYRVVQANDAESALGMIESGLPIDLLFTDVVMPGTLKSTDLAHKARELIPHLPVLFTSGYSQNMMIHSGRLDEKVELLGKPYTREALARKLRLVLATAPPAQS